MDGHGGANAHDGHGHDHGHGHGASHRPVMTGDDRVDWDAVYAGDGEAHVWSGAPNGTLVREVAGMPPGTVLDVGCGEGADAVWLAGEGWSVTGLEPSAVALARASDAAAAAGVEVTWVNAGLLEADGLAGFDLVSAQYPALRKAAGDAIGALLGAVAPGGTLLFVHHGAFGHDVEESGFDPDDYVQPPDVAARLDASWTVEVHETRPRPDAPPDAMHVDDVVLRARRDR